MTRKGAGVSVDPGSGAGAQNGCGITKAVGSAEEDLPWRFDLAPQALLSLCFITQKIISLDPVGVVVTGIFKHTCQNHIRFINLTWITSSHSASSISASSGTARRYRTLLHLYVDVET